MSANNTRITELDFDTIKANLRAYLEANPEFTDYNFEGSGLSLILDMLAMNTHYLGYYANMAHNESFLDSAVKRASVVSRAKELGYTPRSAIGATATVDVEVLVGGDTPAGVELPEYTVFGAGGISTNSSFTFYNSESAIATIDNENRYWIRNLSIKEGSLNRTRFVATGDYDERFIIPNTNIDTTTLRVTVQTSNVDTTITAFNYATNYTTVTANDPVYFLQEVDGERFEIYFGDGNIGRSIVAGNIIVCEYFVVAGVEANGLREFSIDGVLPAIDSNDTYNARVDTLEAAAGGNAVETTNSIRFYAPKAWTSQNRLVTKDDYTHYIQNLIPNVESVTVWGGEENEPPQYGKVFISLKPLSGVKFSDTAKNNIANDFLKTKAIVSIIPEFVDPDYIYLGVDCAVKYNPNKTTKTATAIGILVTNTINNYFDSNLEKFSSNFYYSKFLRAIDDADASIVGNITTIRMQKRLEPALFRDIGYNLSFSPNKIRPSSLTTSLFSCVINGVQYDDVRFVDQPDELNFSTSYDGAGMLRLASEEGRILLNNVGTINYADGRLVISPLEFIDSKTNDGLVRFTCELQEDSTDVIVLRNNIVILDDTQADPLAGIDVNGLTVEVSVA